MVGFGVYKWTNGRSFEGFWKDNQMNGFGVYKYETPNKVYTGYMKNDKKHGYGELEQKNDKGEQTKYAGSWYNGNRHGLAIYSALKQGATEPKKLYTAWKNGKKVANLNKD